MNRSKQMRNKVSKLGHQIWEQCRKEVEEEMRLEGDRRIRLVPATGYIRPVQTKQKTGPPTELYRSEPIRKASGNHGGTEKHDAKGGQNNPEEQLPEQHQNSAMDDPLAVHLPKRQRIAIDGEIVLEDFPQLHQILKDEEDPLEGHSIEQYEQIVMEGKDPLEAKDQHTVKDEPDPLEVLWPEQQQYMMKAEQQDPLETHLPGQTIIKKECVDGQGATQSLGAALRCWALTHQIPATAFIELVEILRRTTTLSSQQIHK